MPVRFVASALAVEDLPDVNTFLIALADNAEEPVHLLELQKALEADEDDPDSDTYCLVRDGEVTHYGGVTACLLHEHCLILRLDDEAASALGTDGFEVELDLEEEECVVLHGAITRLLQGDRLKPGNLVLG
ncbi:Imm10 family immunity protein [Deinococcus hopiensis]|uniref:Immunity protein 10 n=1 Tax=Deinococcus hopiensis KR-140 TaxID=695939 RepID=A0A1W1ULW5_9DEIO|nr:Imm10 family immunity protein [Deinococcus hopiensis]SMB82050.1 Immunity protein 10 [Deinococcus hopiensis KR-140]